MGRDGLIAGKYRLAEKIGEGAIGVVWRAHDELLGRDVAIKEIRFPPGIAAEQARSLERRTLREARAAARLSGRPGVVFVYEVVYEDDRPWIVMELVRGRTLEQLVRQDGPQPPQWVAALGASVLAALRAAHAAGVVHRDVKPSNVMFDGERTVLTDFGIAALDGGTVLTQTGAILGTPSYMAPEQARGQHATPASDLWSLGATLYAAVEGRPPFDADSVAAVLVAVLTTDPPRPRSAGPLAPVIAGLLVKDPNRRTPAAVLGDQLAVIANSERPPSATKPDSTQTDGTQADGKAPAPPLRRSRLTALAGAGVAAAALVAAVIWQPWQTPHTQATPRAGTSSPKASTPAPTPANRHFPSTLVNFDANIFAVAFSPDGTRLACAASDGSIRLVDVRRHTQLSKIIGHTAPIHDIRFSRDGRMLATASDDKTARVWDVATGEQLAVLTGTGNEVWTVDFSPDGHTLASGSKNHTIRIWDIASERTIQVLQGHHDPVYHVRFSRDGRTLASASWDGTVRLWNVGTWDQRAVLSGHTGAAEELDFSPDRRTLASSGQNGEIFFWDLATNAKSGALANGSQLITSIDFSPDGKTLANGDMVDHEVVLWDVATNEKVATLKGHKSQVDAVEFSPDGTTLASSADDQTVRLWDMTR